jgi:Flp pilus assembly protein TadG
MLIRPQHRADNPRGAVAAEMICVLPFLIFLVAVGVDLARLFYCSQILNTCARNGAIYASDQYHSRESLYTFHEATFRDASNLAVNQRSVDNPIYGTDAEGREFVSVTVRYQFQTITRYFGIPHEIVLSRSVQMNIVPGNPDGS